MKRIIVKVKIIRLNDYSIISFKLKSFLFSKDSFLFLIEIGHAQELFEHHSMLDKENQLLP